MDKKQANREAVAEKFNIWADGSFHPAQSVLGVGYLIYKGPHDLVAEAGEVFRRTGSSTSTIAELMSCTAALARLPDGCRITIHSDCVFVVDHIQNHDFSHRRPGLNKALCDLFNQIARHQCVEAVRTHESESRRLKRAHDHSVLARRNALFPSS